MGLDREDETSNSGDSHIDGEDVLVVREETGEPQHTSLQQEPRAPQSSVTRKE